MNCGGKYPLTGLIVTQIEQIYKMSVKPKLKKLEMSCKNKIKQAIEYDFYATGKSLPNNNRRVYRKAFRQPKNSFIFHMKKKPRSIAKRTIKGSGRIKAKDKVKLCI